LSSGHAGWIAQREHTNRIAGQIVEARNF
jgi:hypothetical protein